VIYATENFTHTDTTDITDLSKSLVVNFPCWVATRRLFKFRLANDTDTPQSVCLQSSNDRLTFSDRQYTDFSQIRFITARANGCSDCVWIAIDTPIDAIDELVEISIGGGITLEIQFVSTWDNRSDPYERYRSDRTDSLSEFFSDKAAVLSIWRYDPVGDKRLISRLADSALKSERDLADVQRWTNPRDIFWTSPLTPSGNPYDPYDIEQVIKTRAFFTDKDPSSPSNVDWRNPSYDYNDTTHILLPPETFLHRIYCPYGVVSCGGGLLYQRTAYICQIDGTQWSLEHLKAVFMEQLEFVYWAAELREIIYPDASSELVSLPWCELFSYNGDQVKHRIKSFTRQPDEWEGSAIPIPIPTADSGLTAGGGFPSDSDIDSGIFNVVNLTTADSPYTVSDCEIDVLICDSSDGSIIVNLPDTNVCPFSYLYEKNTGGNQVVVRPHDDTQTIDGETEQTLGENDCMSIVNDSNVWIIF